MEIVYMFLNGKAISGGPLAPALSMARFCGERRTAARYRFMSVGDEFPALALVDSDGVSDHGQLYTRSPMPISDADLRVWLLPREAPELELTVIELENGPRSLCKRLRPDCAEIEGMTDITQLASWREHLANLQKGDTDEH